MPTFALGGLKKTTIKSVISRGDAYWIGLDQNIVQLSLYVLSDLIDCHVIYFCHLRINSLVILLIREMLIHLMNSSRPVAHLG